MAIPWWEKETIILKSMGPLIVVDSLEVILELYSFICSEGWDFDKWLDSYCESIVNHPGYQGVHHS